MGRTEHVDYLVVGAGAAGLAFTDALIDHGDATVAVVDRRASPGGHWNDAYPFVQLHQASLFYGVASTQLGQGEIQTDGPEAGLHERATGAQVREYYEDVLEQHLLGSGRVDFHGRCDYIGGGTFRELDTGTEHNVRPECRIVDARYLSPVVPAGRPAPFVVDEDARVVPVGESPAVRGGYREFVVVGSGKTATDACVWLLQRGIDPDRIRWVRPREPWMLDRARVQPDPAAILGMAADTMAAAAGAADLDDLFLSLEERGVVVRIDPGLNPTMAKTPTLGRWELDLLRSIGDVIRLGHVRRVGGTTMWLDQGDVPLVPGTLVVDCAADGLPAHRTIPIWAPGEITIQPIRTGFPCFGAALAGYVEATRPDDDTKNRLCPSTPYGNSLAEWAAMTLLGSRAAASFMAEPDIAQWANEVPLNPARIPAGYGPSPELDAARASMELYSGPGMARLAQLAGLAS